jgi:hypothetical protein
MLVAVSSVLAELTGSQINFWFWVENGFQKLNLLLFYCHIFLSNLIKLSNKSVNFDSIVGDLIETFVLQFLFFDLNVFVLLIKVSILFSKSIEISLSAFKVINFLL